MQWWCSASNTAWSWTWRPYPGIWALVVALYLAVRQWNAWSGKRMMTGNGAAGGSVVVGGGAPRAFVAAAPFHPLFAIGLLVLWLALDWPLGALGAGYLASVHMVQFMLIALVAPPLLLRGPSDGALQSISGDTLLGRLVRRLTAPVLAIILFNATVLLTHIPAIVDALMVTQLGSMAIDLAWLVAGTIFWWPIIAPFPQRPRFPPPLRMLYLIIGLMFSPVMFGLVGFLVYSQTPLYGIFELAPPMSGLTSMEDHQIAGAVMSVGGATIAFIAITVIFFRWSKAEG